MGIRLFLQEGRIPSEYQFLLGNPPMKVVQKTAAVKNLLILDMNNAPDVPNGGISQLVGFGLCDTNGEPVKSCFELEFAAFTDASCTQLASEGVHLSDVVHGFILGGEGTPWIKVKTDTNGEFACVLTSIPRGTITLACQPSVGGPIVDCSEHDNVTFKPIGVQ